MNRRSFIAASIAVGSIGAWGCSASRKDNATPPGTANIPPFELEETTVAALQDGMKSGRYTARSITELYLRRIAAIDKQGPALHSIIELNPDALQIADALDAERKVKGPRGWLHGIPVLLKDNIDTADKMTTTAGSLALEGSIPPQDSTIAKRLRESGAISRAGIIPISHNQDTAGPMCRTVTDAAILLSALAGVDARDSATTRSQGNSRTDYTAFLDANGLKGMRIGVSRSHFAFNPYLDKLMEGAIDVLKRGGADIVDPANVDSMKNIDDVELMVLLYDLKADLNAYLASLGPKAPVKMLKEIIEFNQKHADKELQYFSQDLFMQAEEKGPLTDAAYLDAVQKIQQLAREQGIDLVMTKNRLDALIAPTNTPAWVTDHLNGDRFSGGSSTPAAVAGYPSITVPCGYAGGMPVGISFFGRAWSEPTLIKIAFAYEQATRQRRAPKFLTTLEGAATS